MDQQEPTAQRIVHAYDTTLHRIVCGVAGQTSSTKHAGGVTCARCRVLLAERAQAAGAAEEGASAPS